MAADDKKGIRVLTWWKGMATAARPTFHSRNLISGIFNKTTRKDQ